MLEKRPTALAFVVGAILGAAVAVYLVLRFQSGSYSQVDCDEVTKEGAATNQHHASATCSLRCGDGLINDGTTCSVDTTVWTPIANQ